MKSVIIYCSNSGTTEKLAEKISSDIGCKMIKIEPLKHYGGYISAVIKAVGEVITNSRPGYKNGIPDLSEYDTVLFGFPIWCSDVPRFAAKFIEDCGLSGKKVIPFSTSGTTHISSAIPKLKEICPSSEFLYPFSHAVSKKDDYGEWIEKIKSL